MQAERQQHDDDSYQHNEIYYIAETKWQVKNPMGALAVVLVLFTMQTSHNKYHAKFAE